MYELDYRRTFEQLDRDEAGKEDTPPGVFTAIYCAALSCAVWSRAWFGRHKNLGKSLRTRLQLYVGFAMALLLVLFAVFVLLTAAIVIANRIGWVDISLEPAPEALLLGGLVTGAGYLALRRTLLRAATQGRRLVRYYDEPPMRQRLSTEVARSIDDLVDEGYSGDIHLVAYSFGSSIALDAMLCYSGDGRLHRRVGEAVTSLVTVGCPYDIERLFFPDRLIGRQATSQQVSWRNIFIASDLFASNFVDKDDDAAGTVQTPWGVQVQSVRYLPDARLTWFSFFRLAAYKQHNSYWHEQGGCWASVLDLWDLAPTVAENEGSPPPPTLRSGNTRPPPSQAAGE
ncbi:hypothetical protein JOD57_003923 [Geodermatophilus bullaregiensis]|uniref:hypothetical protein n=1 Tax=Geodermatophilus bullaregiensis TaxID=1564160 RepID=UPI00195E3D88|nr:hypothetical protein [Geodermatophilus bullaregiensis]MBM7808086.1 hypothetical protein [Geodermatophilus bullaregiensis]